MARHPKREALAKWLTEASPADADLDEHISTCEYCASELEIISLSVSNDDPEPSEIGPALLTLLAPPDDLHERVSERLAARLQRRQDLELFGSMLGIPREAGEVFLSDSPTPPTPLEAGEADEEAAREVPEQDADES